MANQIDLLFFSLIVCLSPIIYCFNETDLCKIPFNKRIRIGNENIKEMECVSNKTERFACFDSEYGCYRSTHEIPGFHLKLGDVRSSDFPNFHLYGEEYQSPKKCSEMCLKYSHCYGFTLTDESDRNEYCYLKTISFNKAKIKEIALTYDRYAFKDTTCSTGLCLNSTKILNRNYSNCRDECLKDNNCKNFDLTTKTCILGGDCQVNKMDASFISCTKNSFTTFQPILKNDELEKLFDKNLNSCISLEKINNILRFPYPGVDKQLAPINVTINGENLQCGLNIDEHILVYTPKFLEFDIKFENEFKLCNLIESKYEKCEYECTCDGRYCEGIYINSFSINHQNSNLCEIIFK